MKFKTIAIAIGITLLSAFAALAAEGPYLSVSAGTTLTSDSDIDNPYYFYGTGKISYDPGIAVAAAFGNDFDGFRIEGELGYKTADIDGLEDDIYIYLLDSGEVSQLSFMANGYIDFRNKSQVTPFVTAGLGFARTTLEIDGEEEDDLVFAYQAGAGLAFAINDQVKFDLTYKYFATSDADLDSATLEYASHNVTAGLRFNF